MHPLGWPHALELRRVERLLVYGWQLQAVVACSAQERGQVDLLPGVHLLLRRGAARLRRQQLRQQRVGLLLLLWRQLRRGHARVLHARRQAGRRAVLHARLHARLGGAVLHAGGRGLHARLRRVHVGHAVRWEVARRRRHVAWVLHVVVRQAHAGGQLPREALRHAVLRRPAQLLLLRMAGVVARRRHARVHARVHARR